jgi:hypothetical protein
MGQCNAHLPTVAPRLIVNRSSARPKTEPSPPATLRGLELINSCKKFYENGVGVPTPSVQLFAVLDKPASRQRSLFRTRRGTIAVMCSFFLVLPGLALATIVWWSAANWDGGEAAASDQSAVSAELGPAGAARDHLQAAAAQSTKDAQSGIIVHKVKTELISGLPR